MPPLCRFGGGGREKKKQAIIEKLKAFFKKYSGIGSNRYMAGKETVYYHEPGFDAGQQFLPMAAEPEAIYGRRKRVG